MTIAFVLGGLYLALGLAVLGGPRARGFLAVTAWPVALGISLVRRIRRARAMEPANSHPGRVIPPGVPILQALREVPDEGGNTAAPCGGRPSNHVLAPVKEEAPREVEKGTFHAMGDVLREFFRQVDEFREDERGTPPIPTGFPSLDRLIGGLRPGCLHVVAGRPSMGKTSFILSLAERVALAHRKRILLFSPGTSAVDLIHAMVCSHGRVNSFRLRTGRAEEEDLQNLVIAAGSLYEAPIFVDDTPCLGVTALLERAREMKGRGLDLVVVDGMEGFPPEPAGLPASTRLKALARELEVPVVTTAPLDRGPERRRDHRPVLSDLASPSTAEDADVVLLLYREDYYDVDSPRKGACDAIVAKNAAGPTGTVELRFLREFMRFEDPGAGPENRWRC